MISEELVDPRSLRPHPRNYQTHPPDQLEHLRESIRRHGFFRNVVITRDGTILAGHGAVEASIAEGFPEIPVRRLDYAPDDPRALHVLAADNEIPRLADRDDRALTELLRELRSVDDVGLTGTGYDDQQLAALVMVTRSEGEIDRAADAAQWVGMPEYESSSTALDQPRVIVNVETVEQRQQVLDALAITYVSVYNRNTLSVWWPPRERGDQAALRFEDASA